MRVTLITAGSRGDVQPFLALALGFLRDGHDVTLATHDYFADWIRGYGLKHAALEGDVQSVLRSEDGKRWLESNKNPVRLITGMLRIVEPLLEKMLEDGERAARDAELLVLHPMCSVFAQLAKQRGQRAAIAGLQPWTPSRDYPSPLLPPGLPLGGWGRQFSHRLMSSLIYYPLRRPAQRWASRHGFALVEPLGFMQRLPIVYGFSAHVVPPPSTWPKNVVTTGYWFLDQPGDFTPPPALEHFLAAGEAPIYVGFGSMTERDPEETTRLVLDAVALSGVRCVLSSGWAGLRGEHPNVFTVGSLPHDWLFPKMRAIVHHGGAGTTSAAFRAGVPAVVVPFFADQHFWADRAHKIGAATAPLPRASLQADGLAQAIVEATRLNAREVGQIVGSERGVERAVERLVSSSSWP